MVFGGGKARADTGANHGAPSQAPLALAYRAPGALEVVYAAKPGARASYGVTDETGARHPLAATSRGQAAIARLNLLDRPRRKGGAWTLTGGGRDSQVGVNFSEAWAIPASETWFARSRGEAVSVLWFIDPDGGATPITPGLTYRFELLAAVHRCRAELVLQLRGARGELLEEMSRSVSADARGGRAREGYDHVLAEFEAAPGAVALAIGVRKGGGPASEDSFLFVAKPKLAPAPEGQEPLDLPAEAVERAALALRQELTVERAWLPLPQELVDGAPHELTLLLEAGAGLQEARGVRIPPGAARNPAAPPETGAAPEPGLVVSPLRATLAYNRSGDAEGRQLAAYRTWLERAQAGAALPDLDQLSRALEAGRIGRTDLFELEFPKTEGGELVTVCLRGDGDLETVWLSLAALLLAANRAPAKVVVETSDLGVAAQLSGLLKNVRVEASHQRRAEETPFTVVLEPGWEPVAGWLDELLAVFDNFDGVGAAGAKLIELDGRMAAAGALIDRKGEIESLGLHGNPRDPRYGYVRAVDAIRPLMVRSGAATDRAEQASSHPALAQADLALGIQQQGERVVYAPTAELWRIKGCEDGAEPPADQLTRFKSRWAPVFAAPAMRERHAALRVLFIDQEAPTIDMDAGGYAAFQEIRLLQAMGAKVDFLPKNLAWMDRHTLALERAGVECHYAPFVRGFDAFLRERAKGFDLVFVVRHKVAGLVQEALKGVSGRPKLVLNLADLHFLREAREAAAGTPGFTRERAEATRQAELEAIAAADLTLTYSDIEAAVIESHALGEAKVAIAPWVVEARGEPIGSYSGSDGLMFLGGFGHPPNAEAVKRFAREVMPLLAERRPALKLTVVGSKPPPDVLALDGPNINIRGYVEDLDEVFAASRIFVAPLWAGAGLKGKVIEALSRGVPAVLSPIAAEGAGLAHGHDCLIARSPQEWVEAIEALLNDQELWERLARNALATARRRFSFEAGVEQMREALALVDIHAPSRPALVYRHARPDRHGGASAAPAVLRLP